MFQPGANTNYYSIIELYNNIMFYLLVLGTSIAWFLITIIFYPSKKYSSVIIGNKYTSTVVEIIWTIMPGIILIIIAIPSFKLLYLMDVDIDESLTIKTIGYQWYWSIEYGDLFSFNSYLLPLEELSEGQLRLLEVDNRIVLPVLTPIKNLVTSADVIHCWSIPSLGLKIDGIPGRINQVNFTINRTGIYMGQCQELCGSNHYAMPIVIEAVSFPKFISWLKLAF